MSNPSSNQRWPWWHRQTPTTRRSLRALLALLVTGALSLAIGVSTATAQSTLGPHKAHYATTLDREVRLNLGPLGSIILDSPLPWPLGVDVVVHQIPADVLDEGQSPLPGLASDLAAYGQLISVPEAAVTDAANALVADALGRTVVIWSMLLLVIAAGRLASGGRLREEVKAALARPGVAPLVGAVAVAAVVTPLVPAMQQQEAEGQQLRLLHGTPLEEARITGRLAALIDTYGSVVVRAYRENQEFYADVSENLAAAYADDGAAVTPLASPTPSPTPQDPPDPLVTDPGLDTGDQAPTVAPTPEVEAAEPAPDPEPVPFLLVSDLHCNVGMADVVAEAARLSEARAVLDAGDTVMNGTSVESFCVNAFAGAIPPELPWVVSTGNHDSVLTAEQGRNAGFTVLDGQVVEVAGVRILGDTDPTLTSIGEGTIAERDETIPDLGFKLAETACELADSDPVDVLLIHNPRAGEAALQDGCVPLQLSGHWHRRVGPEPVGQGVRLVSTSTGGGAEGGTTMGPLRSAAELTVVRIDAVSGAPMDYRIIEIRPDATVSLGEWFAFPQPESPAADGGVVGAEGDEPAEDATADDAGADEPAEDATADDGGADEPAGDATADDTGADQGGPSPEATDQEAADEGP